MKTSNQDTKLTVDEILKPWCVEMTPDIRAKLLQLLEDVAPEKRTTPQSGVKTNIEVYGLEDFNLMNNYDNGYDQAVKDYLARIKELFQ